MSKNLQNTFKVHVNHRPVIEPFRPPTFVPISIKSFPKLCLKVGWWMWILVKNGQLWPNFGSTRSRRNRWKSPETNELDRVLSLHTRFCYDPSSGYKVVTLRSETQINAYLNEFWVGAIDRFWSSQGLKMTKIGELIDFGDTKILKMRRAWGAKPTHPTSKS